MTVAWFDQSNLADLVVSENEFSKKAARYFEPFIRNGVRNYVANIDSELALVQVDDLVFPVTVNSREYENSYVVSPYTQYVSYAYEELSKLRQPRLEALLRPVIRLLGALLKVGSVNRVVIVNNWLFSTNLYPAVSSHQIGQVVGFLQSRFPRHAIVFRSVYLNEEGSASPWQPARLIFSRQVYFWKQTLPSKDLIRDFKVLNRLTHESERLSDVHGIIDPQVYDRVTELYRSLYIQKYSKLNPQYSSQFWMHALESGALAIEVLKDCSVSAGDPGAIQGFCTFFDVGQTTSSPAIGYDCAQPQKMGLYRMVEALSFRRAISREARMNLSAGAPQFKRARGGVPKVEYMAVFSQHLGLRRRAPWWLLQKIANGLALKLVQENEL